MNLHLYNGIIIITHKCLFYLYLWFKKGLISEVFILFPHSSTHKQNFDYSQVWYVGPQLVVSSAVSSLVYVGSKAHYIQSKRDWHHDLKSLNTQVLHILTRKQNGTQLETQPRRTSTPRGLILEEEFNWLRDKQLCYGKRM